MAVTMGFSAGRFLWCGMLWGAVACGETARSGGDTDVMDGTGGHSSNANGTTSRTAASSGVGGSRSSSATAIVTTAASTVTGGVTGGVAVPICEDDLRVVASVEALQLVERRRNIVSFGDSLIAIASWDRIDYHDASLPDSEFALPALSITNEQLGFGEPDDISELAAHGDTLAVLVQSGNESAVLFLNSNGNESMPRAELEADYGRRLTVAPGRIALRTGGGIVTARLQGDAWVWSAPFVVERGSPLAFVDDLLLVGIDEGERDSLGAGGAAGAAGAGSQNGFESALIALMSETGDLVRSFETVGNPRRAMAVDGGWLIAQTNSFWGSYRAALQWFDPSAGVLTTLSEVPVYSSADGEDGAFDIALHGQRLYVANCEAGLLSGIWSREAVSLSSVADFPPSDLGRCYPDQLAIAGDALVMGTNPRVFTRFCQE